MNLPDLEQLRRALRLGDRVVIEGFIATTHRRFYTLAARLLGSSAEAEDVLQDSYLRIFKSVSAVGPPDGLLTMAWLSRIVMNQSIDVLRRRDREKRYARLLRLQWLLPKTAPQGETSVALRRLQGWLAELPVEQRVALILKELEGMTVPEIAASIGVSQGAVEQRLVRARAALRAKQGKEYA